MNTVIKSYDKMIENMMNKSANENKYALDSELITKIPFTNSYTNSISVAVGKQRSGKTRKIIKEMIKISKLHKPTHLVIYVNKTVNKTDKTFESFKGLIKVPILYVRQDDIEEVLMDLIKWKNVYNTIKKEKMETKVEPEQQEEIFEHLHIKNFKRPFLHTLVLLDDIANSPMLKKPTSQLNSLMTQCAHINCSFFLAVQYWIGLPAAIKSQVSVIYLFGGFSRQQLQYMLQQITLSDPFSVIFEQYKALQFQDFLIVDTVEGEYEVNYAINA